MRARDPASRFGSSAAVLAGADAPGEADVAPERSPKVSAIMPAYNEAAFIEEAIDSAMDGIVTEMLVVDGGSTDGTRENVTRLMDRHPAVRLIHNPRRTAASAMNTGLQHAVGDTIVRLDAHSVYPPGYVARLVGVLQENHADVTGGVWKAVPRRSTPFGRAVAAGIGNKWVLGSAGYRVGGGVIRPVDTVPFGCWRAETLRRAGGFNEAFVRSQDYELSERLRRVGATILLVPDVVIEYQARSGVWENAKHQFSNGYWVGHPLTAWGTRFRSRHLAPAGACLGAVGLLATCLIRASWSPLALAAPYGIVILMAAREAARSEQPSVVAMIPFVALSTHISYGCGTLWGALCGGLARLRRSVRATRSTNGRSVHEEGVIKSFVSAGSRWQGEPVGG
jgi:succinoglycan biosynthesis protein ExoA